MHFGALCSYTWGHHNVIKVYKDLLRTSCKAELWCLRNPTSNPHIQPRFWPQTPNSDPYLHLRPPPPQPRMKTRVKGQRRGSAFSVSLAHTRDKASQLFWMGEPSCMTPALRLTPSSSTKSCKYAIRGRVRRRGFLRGHALGTFNDNSSIWVNSNLLKSKGERCSFENAAANLSFDLPPDVDCVVGRSGNLQYVPVLSSTPFQSQKVVR